MQTQQPTIVKFNLAVKTASMAAGLGTGRLAGALGLTPTAMSYKLNGRRPWRFDEVDAIAELFGVEPTDLLGGLTGDWMSRLDSAKIAERVAAATAAAQDGDHESSATRPYVTFSVPERAAG
jgi:hypothetical protein